MKTSMKRTLKVYGLSLIASTVLNSILSIIEVATRPIPFWLEIIILFPFLFLIIEFLSSREEKRRMFRFK